MGNILPYRQAVVIVSVSLPQFVPAMALSILFLVISLLTVSLAWILNVSIGSKVTPRILGFFTVGRHWSLMIISSYFPSSLVQDVNRVEVDFSGES